MKSCLSYYGGKGYMAKHITALMPFHNIYVEPFFGGGAVLFAKDPEGTAEVIGDVDRELTNFWRVLQDPDCFAHFHRRIVCVPYSEVEFLERDQGAESGPVSRAIATYIRFRQSFASGGKSFRLETRLRRGMAGSVSQWLGGIDRLPEIHARLIRVAIRCLPADMLIPLYDGVDTLFYCDPPYPKGTRVTKSAYAHEMTDSDHEELLDTLTACRGKVMLSGYQNKMYDSRLAQWVRHDFPTLAGEGRAPRVESVWCNF